MRLLRSKLGLVEFDLKKKDLRSGGNKNTFQCGETSKSDTAELKEVLVISR